MHIKWLRWAGGMNLVCECVCESLGFVRSRRPAHRLCSWVTRCSDRGDSLLVHRSRHNLCSHQQQETELRLSDHVSRHHSQLHSPDGCLAASTCWLSFWDLGSLIRESPSIEAVSLFIDLIASAEPSADHPASEWSGSRWLSPSFFDWIRKTALAPHAQRFKNNKASLCWEKAASRTEDSFLCLLNTQEKCPAEPPLSMFGAGRHSAWSWKSCVNVNDQCLVAYSTKWE